MNDNPSRRKLLLLGAASAGLGMLPARAAPAQSDTTATTPRLDVPYVPTPQQVVDRMLALAKVGKNDVLYDLGCGDGRIVVTAAKQLGARGTGIDIDPAIATGREVCEALMRRGVLAKDTHGSTIRLAPPIVVEEADLDWAVGQLAAVLEDLRG